MTEQLKQNIKEEVMKLPKEVQEAINAFDWVKITEEIGVKYQLNEEEVNNFQAETALVLTGLTNPKFFATNIENQLETTEDKAEAMVDEAAEKIFRPIESILEENIKKNLKNKDANWRQTLNFVFSGGDYSAFLAPEGKPAEAPAGKSQNYEAANRKGEDIKSKFVI